MPKRWCIGCGDLFDLDLTGTLRCPACQATATAKRQARPNTTRRGYGGAHQKLRAKLLAEFAVSPSPPRQTPSSGMWMLTAAGTADSNTPAATKPPADGDVSAGHAACTRVFGGGSPHDPHTRHHFPVVPLAIQGSRSTVTGGDYAPDEEASRSGC